MATLPLVLGYEHELESGEEEGSEGSEKDTNSEDDKEIRGGYDCEFVERPSDVAQGGECPVCLLVLKEPCLINCCGHKYCRVCIKRVEEDAKPCPLCKEPNFTFMQERALERYLKSLDVFCCFKKEGCEWRGKLGIYEDHLNRNPSPENLLEGCRFVEVECMHECGERFQRRHITTHQTKQCMERPYSCDYCKDYDSTFEDVTETHYPQCSKYPIDCPNKCREYPFERQQLESHLKDECPLTLVDCLFHYAGCDVQLPRKDMPEHNMKETVTHLTLLASITHKLVKENQEYNKTCKALQQEVTDLKLALTSYSKLVKENQELRETTKKKDHQYQKKQQAMQREMQKDMHCKAEEVKKQSLPLTKTPLNVYRKRRL